MKETTNLNKNIGGKVNSLDRENEILTKSKEKDSLVKRMPMDLRKGGLK